jgi:hypothetical protein
MITGLDCYIDLAERELRADIAAGRPVQLVKIAASLGLSGKLAHDCINAAFARIAISEGGIEFKVVYRQ